jgi:uncharacterized protein (DUF1015 family)
MAEVRPFGAIRYGEALARDLGNLIAPPYDVNRPDLLAALLERSPYNMVHLEHVRPDPGDDPHELAAARFRLWLREGVLARDDAPAFYRYDHTFAIDGRRLTRRGIFAAVRLADWDERIVLPHEGTFPGPVGERLRRLRAVRTNLSPIYLLARDPAGDFRSLLAATDTAGPTVEAVDPDGEGHRLTTLTDGEVGRRLQEVLTGRPLYVADGHHRYEAALAYRTERRGESGRSNGHEYVLALISDADDPSVAILPTHRLVRALPEFDPDGTRAALARKFELDHVPAGADSPLDATFGAVSQEAGTICLARFAGEAGYWRLHPRSGSPHAALLPPDRSPAWRALPTAVLEHVILEQVLGLSGDRRFAHVAHTHDAATAVAAVEHGEAQIAFLLRPSTVDELIAVADAGDRMPPKSTYFSPKVPAGLVIHDLTD